MKTAFIDFSSHVFDKHHVYTLGSYLNSKDIDVHYINENSFDKAIRSIKELEPDVLLYNAYASDADLYIKFDKIIKNSFNGKSIMGGSGATFDYSLSERSTIDAFCVGEGEIALTEYIQNGFSACKNIILRGEKGGPKALQTLIDLDSIPIPDRTIVYEQDVVLKNMSTKQFFSGRGCPYKCTYCHNSSFNRTFKDSGKIIRKKSVDYLIEEVLFTYKKYPFENLLFHDDTFMANKKWFIEFCNRFGREVGIKYSILGRANYMNEETAQALKESGCIFVSWSIESANDYIRNDVLKRRMSIKQILNAGSILNKYKIPHKIGSMLGLPGETVDDMMETLKLNIDAKPNISLATIFQPYPGVEITDYALKNNYVTQEALENLPTDYFSYTILNYTPKEKRKISRLAWFFPTIVDFPFLFRNKLIFNMLLSFPMPKVFIRIFYEIYYLVKYSRQFKVKSSFYVSWLILLRHLREKLGLHKPDKNYVD